MSEKSCNPTFFVKINHNFYPEKISQSFGLLLLNYKKLPGEKIAQSGHPGPSLDVN
jgi:hypothetical protein